MSVDKYVDDFLQGLSGSPKMNYWKNKQKSVLFFLYFKLKTYVRNKEQTTKTHPGADLKGGREISLDRLPNCLKC